MSDYKVGDEIVVVVDSPDGNDNIHMGDVGTITFVEKDSGIVCRYDIGVDFGRDVGGHECYQTCPDTQGWLLNEGQFEIVSDAQEMEGATDDEMNGFLISLMKTV